MQALVVVQIEFAALSKIGSHLFIYKEPGSREKGSKDTKKIGSICWRLSNWYTVICDLRINLTAESRADDSSDSGRSKDWK